MAGGLENQDLEEVLLNQYQEECQDQNLCAILSILFCLPEWEDPEMPGTLHGNL